MDEVVSCIVAMICVEPSKAAQEPETTRTIPSNLFDRAAYPPFSALLSPEARA